MSGLSTNIGRKAMGRARWQIATLLERWRPYAWLQRNGRYHVVGDSYFELRPLNDKTQEYRKTTEPILCMYDTTLTYTVNAYLAIIANATYPAIVDVDQQVFAGRELITTEDVVKQLHAVCRSARLYATHAGWRAFIFDPWHPADSSEANRLMTKLGADPRYMRLCCEQSCYRARLTPKPWRQDEDRVCEFVDAIGGAHTPDSLLVDVHDAMCLLPHHELRQFVGEGCVEVTKPF